MATILKENSARGRQIISQGSRYAGKDLRQVYGRWSRAKESAYNHCWEKYLNTPEHDAFSICSANTYGFSVSWTGLYEGQPALFYETKSNSYIVLFEN